MNFIQSVYEMGRLVPEAPRRLVKGLVYRALFAQAEGQRIVLNTIPKSGTTLVSVIFANYMNLSLGGPDQPVSLKDLHTVFVPNSREMLIQGGNTKPPHPFFASTRYKDIFYSHSYRFLEFCQGPVVFLYRNPLDYLVSLYFYNLRFGGNNFQKEPFASVGEALVPALNEFANHFCYMEALFGRRRVFPIAYENLTSATDSVISVLFDWLGLPIQAGRLQRAIELASMDNLRKLEQNEGTFNSESRPSSMFRSGKIGQWQEHLSPIEIDRARTYLAARGIPLERFRLT